MAYVSQERKANLAPQIKAVLKKYGMKGTIAVRHHSTLVVNIRAGKLDVCGNWFENLREDSYYLENNNAAPESLDVNTYHIDSNYTGEVADFLNELVDAMNGVGSETEANFDKSDSMTDYFHVGWYIDINVGRYNKPYILEGAKAAPAPVVEERDEWAELLNAGVQF